MLYYTLELLYLLLLHQLVLILGKNSDISQVSEFFEYFHKVDVGIIIGKFILNIIFSFLASTFTILTLYNFYPEFVLISLSLSKFADLLINNETDRYYFIAFFALQFFCLLIYLEIIELNFCNLNKNTRRNIQIRGDDDYFGTNEIDSKRESLAEISPGYLVDQNNKDNNKIELMEQTIES